MTEIDTQGYINLMQALIKQARQDVLQSKPGSVVRVSAEKFLASQHFTALTGLDGKPLLRKLQAEYEQKHNKGKRGKRA